MSPVTDDRVSWDDKLFGYCNFCGEFFEITGPRQASAFCSRSHYKKYTYRQNSYRPTKSQCKYCKQEFDVPFRVGSVPDYCSKQHQIAAWKQTKYLELGHSVATERRRQGLSA